MSCGSHGAEYPVSILHCVNSKHKKIRILNQANYRSGYELK